VLAPAAAALALLGASGCGSSSGGTASGPTPNTKGATSATVPAQTTPSGSVSARDTAALEADSSGQLRYKPSTLTERRGNVAIVFTNNSPLAHNVTVADSSGKVLGATPTFTGGSRTLDLSNLKPGTYTFYCTVPGHRQAGMQGTLTVTS
jgi:plastocyanin